MGLEQDVANMIRRFDNMANTVDDSLADLAGVVANEMQFTGVIDPDIETPTGVNGGTFKNIPAFVEAAPAGAVLTGTLAAGKIHLLHRPAWSKAAYLTFKSEAGGLRATVMPEAYSNTTHNGLYSIYANHGLVKFEDVDIDLRANKDVSALPWNGVLQALLLGQKADKVQGAFFDCNVFGANGASLISPVLAKNVELALMDTTLDGDMVAVSNGSQGTASIAHENVTLTNGATLTQGLTAGQNLLTNL